MRWIKKEHSLKLLRTEWRSKGKLLQNYRRPSKLAWSSDLVKPAQRKRGYIEFPFRLNAGNKPNDAQTWKNYSSLYTEDQFQENSEKKMMGHFRGSKIKPAKY